MTKSRLIKKLAWCLRNMHLAKVASAWHPADESLARCSEWIAEEIADEVSEMPRDGDRLTDMEKATIKLLAEAWNVWRHTGHHSDDDNRVFRDSIHRCQDLIALRLARRVAPEHFQGGEHAS